jgi:hypothetical protein
MTGGLAVQIDDKPHEIIKIPVCIKNASKFGSNLCTENEAGMTPNVFNLKFRLGTLRLNPMATQKWLVACRNTKFNVGMPRCVNHAGEDNGCRIKIGSGFK